MFETMLVCRRCHQKHPENADQREMRRCRNEEQYPEHRKYYDVDESYRVSELLDTDTCEMCGNDDFLYPQRYHMMYESEAVIDPIINEHITVETDLCRLNDQRRKLYSDKNQCDIDVIVQGIVIK